VFSTTYLKDLAERVVATFVQAAAGIIIASGGFGVDTWKAAAVAGGLAVVKAIAARGTRDPESASLVK
jgi:predicted transcriptional regulator